MILNILFKLLVSGSIFAPIGFSFRDNPGDINNDGATLEVCSKQTLGLLAGNLNFDEGRGNRRSPCRATIELRKS